MPYCPKCGNIVDENMTFCSRCGAPLKVEGPSQSVPSAPQKAEKDEKGEKQEKQEKGEKHEKSGGGFIGFLIAGLVLAFLGIVAYYDVTTGLPNSQLIGPILLLIIGISLLVVAIYYVMKARRRNP